MLIEDLLKKDHYKSIIALTQIYQDRNNNIFWKKNPFKPLDHIPKGLRQVHYRYALVEQHDNMGGASKKAMDKFYNNTLEHLYKDGTIIRNCITNRNNLTNFLTKLVEYEILNKNIDEKPPTYSISKKYYTEVVKFMIRQSIDDRNADSVDFMRTSDLSTIDIMEKEKPGENELVDITDELEGLVIDGTCVEGGYFGLDFLEQCNKEEKIKIKEKLIQIYINIAFLTKLKYEKMNDPTGIAIFAESHIDKD
jgi:hypothetical protein